MPRKAKEKIVENEIDNEKKVIKKDTKKKSSSATKSTAKSTSKEKKEVVKKSTKKTVAAKSKLDEKVVTPAKKATLKKASTTSSKNKNIDKEEKPTKTTKVSEEVKSKKTTKSSKASEEAKPKKTAKSSKATEEIKPKKATKSSKATGEVKPKKTTKSSKASEEVKPKKTTKSSKASEEVKPKKTTKSTKAAEEAKPKKTTSTRKKSTKKSSETSLQNIQILEYYDLPYKYGNTIVKLLAQTPKTLFVYWEISDEDINTFKQNYGDDFFNITKPILIVHNLTLNKTTEVEINDFANCWYLNTEDSDCKYDIELARKFIKSVSKPVKASANEYLYVAKSNELESPNDHIMFEKLTNVVTFKNYKTNETIEENINSFKFLKDIYKFYQNMYKDELLKNPSSKF